MQHNDSPRLARLARLRKLPVLWMVIAVIGTLTILDVLWLFGWEAPVTVPPPIGLVLLGTLTTLYVSAIALQWFGEIAFRKFNHKDPQAAEEENT